MKAINGTYLYNLYKYSITNIKELLQIKNILNIEYYYLITFIVYIYI